MFDPYMNALPSYANSGNLTGSWLGLAGTGITLANWDHTATKNMSLSIDFFGRELQMPQLLCGYYGTGDGTTAARLQVEAIKGTEGVLGLIYGPWAHNSSAPAIRTWGAETTPSSRITQARRRGCGKPGCKGATGCL